MPEAAHILFDCLPGVTGLSRTNGGLSVGRGPAQMCSGTQSVIGLTARQPSPDDFGSRFISEFRLAQRLKVLDLFRRCASRRRSKLCPPQLLEKQESGRIFFLGIEDLRLRE